jgi:hypothetical protein
MQLVFSTHSTRPHVKYVEKKRAQRLGVTDTFLNRKAGPSFINGLLLYQQLIRSMVHHACSILRSAACSHVWKLQVLISKCLRIANNPPLYIDNRQIHESLWIPSFAEHIRALTESLEPKLADTRNPLVQQLGRRWCWPRADWSPPRAADVDWCSAGQPKLSKNTAVSAQCVIFNYSSTLTEVLVSCKSSARAQFKSSGSPSLSTESFRQSDSHSSLSDNQPKRSQHFCVQLPESQPT